MKNAGKPRTWLLKPSLHVDDGPMWVTQLEEGRYLRCSSDGSLLVYENLFPPPSHSWRELE